MVIITSVVEIELAILINQIKLHLSVFSKVWISANLEGS